MKLKSFKDFNHLDYPIAYESKGRYYIGLGVSTGTDHKGKCYPSFLFENEPMLINSTCMVGNDSIVEVLYFNERKRLLYKGSYKVLAMKLYDYFQEGKVKYFKK